MTNADSFKLIKKTLFKDIADGKEDTLPESDLCFHNEQYIFQYKLEENDSNIKKLLIKPGIFSAVRSDAGVILVATELRNRPLLKNISNTTKILAEANVFFDRLEVYERLGRPKKRAILLYSKPGLGKTSAICDFSTTMVEKDKGTVIVNWPTSEVEPEEMSRLLSMRSEYAAECTKLVLIMEDIGGGEFEREGRKFDVNSSLLNLLDGVNVAFKIPTFIIATTNYPENLLSSLADRPGRFDMMLKLEYPSSDERRELLSFILKRGLSDEENEAIVSKGTETMSIAHVEEIAVRAELHGKTIKQVVTELVEHQKMFNSSFTKRNSIGMGLGGNEDDL